MCIRDRGQRLVGEAVGHDEARVAVGAAQVHQAAFGQHVACLLYTSPSPRDP
ncbi:hypothetical protein [Dyella sp. ASV21]|uniref:hypothetical protein n=1 Tax=Dyella sp. ASV21 TaxID=2795114 RepID=UPI0018EB099F|nr:hypothetical protein [Dyella sp. ASV21]